MAKRATPPPGPWMHWDGYDKIDVLAFKALAAGNANDAQQKRALDIIIMHLCGTYEMTFDPLSERSTAFAEGKRCVGRQIVKLVNMPAGMLDTLKVSDVGRR